MSANVFEQLGLDIKPLINAAGTVTMYCGGAMPAEVVQAMSDVAGSPVRIDELQGAASKFIAGVTGAEAGYVTCGCAAALTLGTAACMTRYNVDRINRLPDTTGMPNEVLIALPQRNAYDHAIRAAGARIVNVGMASHTLPLGEYYRTLAEDYQVNITDRTAMIAYFYQGGGIPPLEDVIAVARKHGVPLMVDAADQIPPVSNLSSFISMGADLVAVSGGKGIRGPQASGLLYGRRDLIEAAALNHFIPGFGAGYVSFERWAPPASVVDKKKMSGVPHHPIGRNLKVSREAVIGLLTALQMLVDEERNAREMQRLASLLEPILTRLSGIAGVSVERSERPPGGFPVLELHVDETRLGRSAVDIVQRLQAKDPPIYVFAPLVAEGEFTINSASLSEEHGGIVAARLYAAVTGN